MRELSCREARLDLQAPESLDILAAHRLDRHLATCDACAEYTTMKTAADHLIRQQLGAASAGASVRQAVLTRLATEEVPVARPARVRQRRSARGGFRVLGIAAAAVAAILAGIVPRMTGYAPTITPASAAWHLQRPNIGFPLTVDPRHPDHLLAGAFGQVYESSNAGKSWHHLAPLPGGYVIRDLAIDAAHPAHYLVAAKRTIFLSTDRGRHWRVVAQNMLGIENMFLLQDQSRPGRFYAGPSVVWTSGDGGRSWSQDGHGYIFAPDGIQSLTVGRDETLYTGIWGGGVGISRNAGQTWQRLTNGLAPNVMDVAMGKGAALWAATDRGVYQSVDEGRQWRHRGPRFFTTSVLPGKGFTLAGGNGALDRTTDGGKTWLPAMAGLPLDPYVYGLVADPVHPNRVYASLDGDGIFRSDDAGRHWQAVDAGIPLAGQSAHPHQVLFLRGGALWITTGDGVDPGVLSVDTDVKLASLSPDGASAAYVAGGDSGWVVRVVRAGGSLARTLLSGHGPLPTLFWSPTASRLAIATRRTVTIVNAAGAPAPRAWTLPRTETALGWSHDGSAILTWNRRTGRIIARAATGGEVVARWPGSAHSLPLLAPGSTAIAWRGATGLIVAASTGIRHVLPDTSRCAPSAWSADGTRLLLTCAGSHQVRDLSGRLLARPHVPADALFAPGNHNALLYFKAGNLWRWTEYGKRLVVTDAAPS